MNVELRTFVLLLNAITTLRLTIYRQHGAIFIKIMLEKAEEIDKIGISIVVLDIGTVASFDMLLYK